MAPPSATTPSPARTSKNPALTPAEPPRYGLENTDGALSRRGGADVLGGGPGGEPGPGGGARAGGGRPRGPPRGPARGVRLARPPRRGGRGRRADPRSHHRAPGGARARAGDPSLGRLAPREGARGAARLQHELPLRPARGPRRPLPQAASLRRRPPGRRLGARVGDARP